MLKFESLFWGTENPSKLKEKLSAFGFSFRQSLRDPSLDSVFFGPEEISFVTPDSSPAGFSKFQGGNGGIYGLGLESDDIRKDYGDFSRKFSNLEKPKRAESDSQEKIPLWVGFSLPDLPAGCLKSWVFMNSPHIYKQMGENILPIKHENTCFGIEAIHINCTSPDSTVTSWEPVLKKAASGLKWNEIAKGEGSRFVLNDRFLDFVNLGNSFPENQTFMITLKVTDLEVIKNLAKKNKVELHPCKNRDGAILPASYTGGPALRFVRSFWVEYFPPTHTNYPYKRRPDPFRSLGGAQISTLNDGFEDNWTF